MRHSNIDNSYGDSPRDYSDRDNGGKMSLGKKIVIYALGVSLIIGIIVAIAYSEDSNNNNNNKKKDKKKKENEEKEKEEKEKEEKEKEEQRNGNGVNWEYSGYGSSEGSNSYKSEYNEEIINDESEGDGDGGESNKTKFESKVRPSKPANCPAGYIQDGATCRRPGKTEWHASKLQDCKTGYKNTGFGTCTRIATNLGRGVGVTKGFLEDWKCPSGYGLGVFKGGCWKGLDSKPKIITWKNPRPAYKNSKGNQVPEPADHKDRKWIVNGLRYYPKCPSGYTQVGCCICQPVGKLTTTDFKDCSGDYMQHTAGRCKINCKKKYGSDWSSDGESCTRPVKVIGMSHMTCPPDYPTKIGARCYKDCESGFKPGAFGLQCITKEY